MVSLLDIAPLTEQVPYRGQKILVRGVTALEVVKLLQDFPQLRRVIADKGLNDTDLQSLIAGVPRLYGQIVACACDQADDEAVVAAAMGMMPGEVVAFLQTISRLTFPQGLKSFLDGLSGLTGSDQGATGWGQATRSPAPSKPASVPATAQKTAGDTPQGSSPDGSNSSSENEPDGGPTTSTVVV